MKHLDKKITDVLNGHAFTLSAEIIPPRNGTEQDQIFSQIAALVEAKVQFLSVTRGAGGSLRGGSLPIAHSIKNHFQIPCIAHFTCRDLTPQEVENLLVDHHYFGIRNILALRGDPPVGQPEWQPKYGSYSYAFELIEQIRELNRGRYLERKNGPEVQTQVQTDFCIGAAAYPEHPDPDERLNFFRLKVEAGAEFGITQMVFDIERYARFLDLCGRYNLNIPILPGTRLLRSKAQAARMAQRFAVSVPRSLLDSFPDDESASESQIADIFFKFTEDLKRRGAPGVHLFVMSDTTMACRIFQMLSV